MNPGSVSIIIPAHNRTGPLSDTLASASAALAQWPPGGEILLVDDGSNPPLEATLKSPASPFLRIHRQSNRGAVEARQTGLALAAGTFVLFLDSDDLIHPRKLAVQAATMSDPAIDVTYCDQATATPGDSPATWHFQLHQRLPSTRDPLELYLTLQPSPQNPLYRRAYLLKHLAPPLLPPQPEFSPSGDVWIYYNLCPHPATIRKVGGPFSAAGTHQELRYSSHWERLGASSLRIMECFLQHLPDDHHGGDVRRHVAAAAFDSWRRLPRDFSPTFSQRMLRLWRDNPRPPLHRLGGPGFQMLARLLGPLWAAQLLKSTRGHSYQSCRTLTDGELAALLRDFHINHAD
jgi:glycosyltransferase involved in cell wall biosynthesis